MLPAMAKLFNLVLNTGIFPQSWNLAYQIPIFKKDEATDCNNYRDISITGCLGKAFNGALCQRLSRYLEDEAKLCKSQTVFRLHYSTIDNIYILKSIVNKYVIRQKQKLHCCFVDLRKAYDNVWREGLL